MRPLFNIDLDELIEYREELDELIKKFEALNVDFDAKRIELEKAGFDINDVDAILDILFKDKE